MKKLLIGLCVIAVLAAGAYFLQNGGSVPRSAGAADAIPQRLIAKAERRDIQFNIQVSGNVTPTFEVEIKSEVGGKVNRMAVTTGQQVKRGDILAEIDDSELVTEKESVLTEIEGSKLRVNLAERNFNRSQELFESRLISKEIYENLQTDLEISRNDLLRAENRLKLVEDKLRRTRLVAPADGIVLSVRALEGQVVTPAASVNAGTTLLTIADLSRLLIVTHVNQIDIAEIKPDSVVPFTSDAFADIRSQATINFIAPVATSVNNTKGFQVEALIDDPDPRLRPGMTVTMDIPVADVRDVVSVPISAVFSDVDDQRVVYVRQGGSSEKRPVRVGVSNLFYAEILDGLQPGEEILLVQPRDLGAG